MEDWTYEDDDFEYDNLSSARYDDHGFLPGREQFHKQVKVPKGTSDYQAKWYLDDVVDDADEPEENDFQERLIEDDAGMTYDMDVDNEEDENNEDREGDEESDDDFVELTVEEEERQLKEYRALEQEDREFPDEIELDPSESGIERLKRYRGCLLYTSRCV